MYHIIVFLKAIQYISESVTSAWPFPWLAENKESPSEETIVDLLWESIGDKSALEGN